MSDAYSPKVKLIHTEHVWRARDQTLVIQDEKKETQAVLLGEDFQKSFGVAGGFLCPRGRCKIGTNLKKKLSVISWRWGFLKLLVLNIQKWIFPKCWQLVRPYQILGDVLEMNPCEE